jgi:lipid-binding SYLF domain-containing protein
MKSFSWASIAKIVLLGFLTPILFSTSVHAASKMEIDLYVEDALAQFNRETTAGATLAKKAKGILIFPKIYKAGVGIGGEYGEGALKINGTTHSYYSVASASLGFQLGAQMRSQIILFMTDEALNQFLNSDGWEAGVDGSVAIATLGAGGKIDTHTAQQPIIGFIFSNRGLMFNLNIEGSKFTPIVRK